ncbi:hypothetical protein B0H34DRAFT_727266 [Crassisporium funariophilum]|nr:hypothetical protein B0H34DRAFT_727266 [Crassisporium funariophilum]
MAPPFTLLSLDFHFILLLRPGAFPTPFTSVVLLLPLRSSESCQCLSIIMPFLSVVFLLTSVLCGMTGAAPIRHDKRIDQVISASTADWQQACVTSGGSSDQCSSIAVTAFTSLLEEGGVCDQQDSGDQMIDLAKQLGNDSEMIRLAQLFVQQPRNSATKLQVPYCQVAPRNMELNGLFHCQFASSDFTRFSGDQTGNVPLGLNSLNPAGSCPAKTDGPVPDGEELNALTQDPGSPGTTMQPSTTSVAGDPSGSMPSSCPDV